MQEIWDCVLFPGESRSSGKAWIWRCGSLKRWTAEGTGASLTLDWCESYSGLVFDMHEEQGLSPTEGCEDDVCL